MPGDNDGFNGINIQEVTYQFWLATSSRDEGLMPCWAGPGPSSLCHSLKLTMVHVPPKSHPTERQNNCTD